MGLSEIKPGAKLELRVIEPINEKSLQIEENNTCFNSNFQYSESESVFWILSPMLREKIIVLHFDTIVEINLVLKGSIIKFRSKIIGRKRENNLYLYKLEKISEFEKIQRRKLCRIDWNLKLKYSVITKMEQKKQEFKLVDIKDISGCGIRIITNEKIDKDYLLKCELQLLNEEYINFEARVIWENKLDIGNYYEVGLEITHISKVAREKIIKDTFKIQRKKLQKEVCK